MTEKPNIIRIAVCSAVGGVGRTTITANLAALLAKEHVKVTVIDADLQFGDIALAFDLHPTLTIKDLAERKDKDNIHFYVMNHESGVHVLPAPDRPEYAELITPDFLNSIIDTLHNNTEVLLIETQAGLNDLNIQLMEKADLILVVGTPRMAVLKNTKLLSETLSMLGLKDKARLVLNKATSNTVIKSKDMAELTNMEQAFFLPFVDKHIDLSLDMGVPIVSSHPKLTFSKEMEKLAESLNLYHSNKKGNFGIFSKFTNKGYRSRGRKNEFISTDSIQESRANY
ncbi:AAA family ATPase [Oceanobacillus sp. CF4.6]|uniref:AAA family ATPase n=1 Tax=Oceanobacillus sp. CF4.6 TaxID=3373080 RepID=UPI003EE6083E